ncbi:DUF6624 domain-containing protein, partial [Tenacibaculum dicentrarchi]
IIYQSHMKRALILILTVATLSCKTEKKQEYKKEIVEIDNTELIEIYDNDQNDRKTDNIDWHVLSKRDSLRRVRVNEILNSNKIKTAKDYINAAMVFQHGNDSTDYGKAVRLMKKAIELDSTTNKWLFAATTDRYLLSKGEPQIYGTQYQKMGDEPWKLAKMDTTKVSDNERIEYGVETLSEQRQKVIEMNNEDHGHGH